MAKSFNHHVVEYHRHQWRLAHDQMLRRGKVPPVLVRKGEKPGEFEWRWKGWAGASYPTHPLDADLRQMEGKLRAGRNKVERIGRMSNVTEQAGKTRSTKGAATIAAVLTLAAMPNVARLGRSMAAHIARRVGVGAHQVRAILKKRKADVTESR